jgi:uncharacterized glyoxalase superfamily protein PhnB
MVRFAPYLYGPIELLEFVRQVFDAIELERFEFGPESFHVEMQIGDSTVVIEAGELPPDVKPWLGSVYVYVADADSVHAHALSLGARLLAAVEDKPYQERQGGFIDEEASADMKKLYVGKRVPDEYRKRGAANPIKYTWKK